MQIRLEVQTDGKKFWYEDGKETWFYSPSFQGWKDMRTKNRYVRNRYDK